MAKQAKKQTLADKEAATKQAAQVTKSAKEIKVKGPIPDFSKNQNRLLIRKFHEEAFAAKARAENQNAQIKEEEARLNNFVKGVPGVYHVLGRTFDGIFSTITFMVKLRWFPSSGEKSAQDVLVIQEPFFRDGMREPIFITHSSLLKKYHKVNFTRGKIGDVQNGMLTFLQNALKKQITEQEVLAIQERFMKMTAPSLTSPLPAGINTMKMLNEEHAAQLDSGDDVLVPVIDVDISSMYLVKMENCDMAST